MNAAADGANWLTQGRGYSNQRFSPLKQINRENVARLVPSWTYRTGVGYRQGDRLLVFALPR